MKKNFAIKKLYYSISEVSKITDLEQHVLRYWETEFEQLKPAKNLAGNRIYTNNDIKFILLIKKLLRDEKYTIKGAKKLLKTMNLKTEIGEHGKADRDRRASENAFQTKLSYVDNNSELSSIETKEGNLKQDLIELKSFLNELLNSFKDET